MKSRFSSPLPALALLFLVGFLTYSNSFQGEFCSDDTITVVNNPSIKHLGNFPEMWKSFNTRFLVGLSFALNYYFGQLNVFGYHLFNLLSHIVASWLVFQFVLLTFKTPSLQSHPLKSSASQIALFSALIFLCHPMQNQGVAFITQRAVSIVAILYLGTILLYVKARLERTPLLYAGAVGAMALGIFTKENILTLPVALTVYEFMFLRSEEKWSGRLMRLAPFYVLSAGLVLILALDRPGSILGLKHQIWARAFSWDYFFTEINVLKSYLRLFIFPVGQRHHYDYPIVHGFFNVPTMSSASVLLAVLFYGIRMFKKDRLIAFCIFWFFITTAVETGIVCFVKLGVMYDHWMYLAIAGLAVVLVIGSFSLFRGGAPAVLVLAIAIFGFLTFERNKVWQNCTTIWKEVIHYAPKKAFPYNNIGVLYSDQGRYPEAVEAFHKGLQVEPEAPHKVITMLYTNLGSVYGKMGDFDSEIKYNEMAAYYDPYNAIAYNNLGLAWTEKGDLKKGISYTQKAIAINPAYSDAYNNLGLGYAKSGEIPKAREYFERALYFDPDNKIARENLNKALAQDNR